MDKTHLHVSSSRQTYAGFRQDSFSSLVERGNTERKFDVEGDSRVKFERSPLAGEQLADPNCDDDQCPGGPPEVDPSVPGTMNWLDWTGNGRVRGRAPTGDSFSLWL